MAIIYNHDSKEYPASEGWYIAGFYRERRDGPEMPCYERLNPATGRIEATGGMQLDPDEAKLYYPDGTECVIPDLGQLA